MGKTAQAKAKTDQTIRYKNLFWNFFGTPLFLLVCRGIQLKKAWNKR